MQRRHSETFSYHTAQINNFLEWDNLEITISTRVAESFKRRLDYSEFLSIGFGPKHQLWDELDTLFTTDREMYYKIISLLGSLKALNEFTPDFSDFDPTEFSQIDTAAQPGELEISTLTKAMVKQVKKCLEIKALDDFDKIIKDGSIPGEIKGCLFETGTRIIAGLYARAIESIIKMVPNYSEQNILTEHSVPDDYQGAVVEILDLAEQKLLASF